MTALNNSVAGRLALRDAIGHYMNRRLGRHWARSAFRALTKYAYNWFDGHATLGDLANDLNGAFDGEIFNCRQWAARWGMTKESFKDEEYWVDPINGSDTNGDGSQTAPFASLWFTPYLFPKIIRHQYTIVLTSDLSMDDFEVCAHFEGRGSLAIIGGANYEVVSSGFVISAVNDYYPVFGMHVCVGIEVDPVVLAPDQHWGTWIRFTSGDANTSVVPVHLNTTNEFIYGLDSDLGIPLPAEDDTFDLIRPAVKLTAKSFRIKTTQDSSCGWSGQIGPDTATPLRLQLCNLEIDTAGSDPLGTQFDLSIDGHFNLSFVRLHKQNYTTCRIGSNIGRKSEMNSYYNLNAVRLLAIMGGGITPIDISRVLKSPGLLVTQKDHLWPQSPIDNLIDLQCFDHIISGVDVRGIIMLENQEAGAGALVACKAGAFDVFGGHNTYCYWSFADGCEDGYGWSFRDTHHYVAISYCRQGIDMFHSRRSHLHIETCYAAGGGETPELTGVGLRVFADTHVQSDECLDVAGIQGDIAWETDGVPTIDQFPAIHNTKYDTVGGAGAVPMGSWVTYPE